MAVESSRRGRGFHKRRHRHNAARAELAEAAKGVVTDTVGRRLVRRQGKGKGGDGKGGGKINEGAGKGKTTEPSAPPPAPQVPSPPAPAAPAPFPEAPPPQAPSAPPLAAEPLPTAAPPFTACATTAGGCGARIVVVVIVNEQCHDDDLLDGGDLGTDNADQRTDPNNRCHSATDINPTAYPSDEHREYTDRHTPTFPGRQFAQTSLTSLLVASPLPTLQTSLTTDVSSTTTSPFVASTPFQAAPSDTTTAPASSSRAPAIAPGTIAGIVVGILSFFFIVLGAVCLFSRRTRRRLLAPVTRRFTNNTLVNSDSLGIGSTGRRSRRGGGGGGGDMRKSLVSDAESMAYTTTMMSPRDVQQQPPQLPPMAMVETARGLSQHPVFTPPYHDPSRPNSWRTWRPSATFAKGLDPLPHDLELPPPPPLPLSARYSGLPRFSGVSTGADSTRPEYGAWPPTPTNVDLTALSPGPGYQQQQQQNAKLATGYVAAAGPARFQGLDYLRGQQGVSYSETPLATPRTPLVVEAGRPETPEGAAVIVETTTSGPPASTESSAAGRTSGDSNLMTEEEEEEEVGGGDYDKDRPEGSIQEAQLGREAGASGGHGGGPQGVEEEPPRQQGQPAEQSQQGQLQDERPGEHCEPVFQEVATVAAFQRQSLGRGSTGGSSTSAGSISQWWFHPHAPPSLPSLRDRDMSRSSSSATGFSWAEAASELYMSAPRDGFGVSIVGAGHGSSGSMAAGEGDQGPSTTPRI
ncbi:hypothetical protein DHEL01_v211163 [Diaporthe helianthi]|uniref:Uncharacterized protein n=1 Tax=Diaporthe helianthi TaxID=158607 RepID=A0A2P5HJK5_DIAHE|nr:hypothetical protein DHEL01_v211163 [Diaporthe helianthi]